MSEPLGRTYLSDGGSWANVLKSLNEIVKGDEARIEEALNVLEEVEWGQVHPGFELLEKNYFRDPPNGR